MEWIVAADVERETWRRLLEFANIEFAEEQIRLRHGAPATSGQAANYRKQAEQMRVALLQAREYFEAAYRTSLITSPNHVYYGMISLASAVMLLLGDGNSSYDALRRDPKNNHHGLSFTIALRANRAAQGTNLLESALVEILDRGHFKNWYRVLPRTEPAVAIVHTKIGQTSTTGVHVVGAETQKSIQELVGTKANILQRLRLLPELSPDLERFGLPVVRSSAVHEVTGYENGRIKHSWRLKNAGTNERLISILDTFSFSSALFDRVNVLPDLDLPSTCGCVVSCELRREDDDVPFSWPGGRMDLNGDFIMYAETAGVHEFADWYFSAYGLSMLSRYFPDLWIACLDAHCKSAKLIEAFVEWARVKVPTLALQLLLGTPIRISTHRAPWHS